MRPLLIALAFSVFLIGAREVQDPNELHRLGVQANEGGQYALAVSYFRQADEIEPDNPTIRANLFNALNNYAIRSASRGNVGSAIQACLEAKEFRQLDVTISSNLAIFFHNQAISLLNAGEFAGALDSIQHAERVVEELALENIHPTIDQSHAQIFLVQGREDYRKGDIPGALENYRKCLEINSDEVLAYIDRSRIYFELLQYREAVEDLEVAASLVKDPDPVQQLIVRLRAIAKGQGVDLTQEDALLVVESSGGSPGQDQRIRKTLKEIRLQVLQSLTVTPKSPLTAVIRWGEPFLDAATWLATPRDEISGDRFEVGVSGTDANSRERKEVLKLQYVLALVRQLGDLTLPYWFAVGLAQVESGLNLTDSEIEELVREAENFAMLSASNLTFPKVAQIRDTKGIRLANLQSKALDLPPS